MADGQFDDLLRVAREQSLAGIVCHQLMASGVRLSEDTAPRAYALLENIRRQNLLKNERAVWLSRSLEEAGIRMLVMKGQTLAALYPDPFVRQSGDIDFYVHPDDWVRALDFVRNLLSEHDAAAEPLRDTNSNKHVEFRIDGIQFEMHRYLLSFNVPSHQRYWEHTVVPGILASPYSVELPPAASQASIPTLAPTYNALYTFIHIFFHLIFEGIGFRQFCDWLILLKLYGEELDRPLLERHLRGLGLLRAYREIGTLLTDHLGLPEELFPLPLTKADRVRLPRLMNNILEGGNFGQNRSDDYLQPEGIIHGVQHLGHIAHQQRLFWRYAPGEVLMCIPFMFRWWMQKIWRMIL